jgi:tetratricopeptide (TPR) repeat protein
MLGALVFLTLAALAAAPQEAGAKSERAARAMLEERFDEARKLYQELLAADPDNPGLLLNLGLAEQSLGRRREAADRFRAAARIQPESGLTWLLLGTALRHLGQAREAIAPLERVLQLEPGNHAAEAELAEALFDLERFPEAATHFFHLAESDPSNPRAWQGLGTCYVNLARRATAEVAREAPESGWRWALEARERLEAGRLHSAFALFRKALAGDPALPGVHSGLAEVYEAAGHVEWAKTEAAREEALPAPDCDREAPACEWRGGRYWQAVEAAARLRGARAAYWRGLAYFELARMAFERLAALPPSAEQYELLAGAHRLMGRHEQAVKLWREALALSPDDQRLQKELARSLAEARATGKDAGTAISAP